MRISFAYLRYICYISLIALIYIYICIHTYIIVRTCVCIYVEMYMHLQIHIHICTHVRMSSSCVSPIHSTVAINCTYTYTHSLFFLFSSLYLCYSFTQLTLIHITRFTRSSSFCLISISAKQ